MAAYKKRLAPLRTHLGVVLDGLTPKMNEWLVESMLIMMGKRSYSQQISAMGNSHLKKVNLWKCKKALLGVVVVVLSCFIQRPVGLLMYIYIYNCIYIYMTWTNLQQRETMGHPWVIKRTTVLQYATVCNSCCWMPLCWTVEMDDFFQRYGCPEVEIFHKYLERRQI